MSGQAEVRSVNSQAGQARPGVAVCPVKVVSARSRQVRSGLVEVILVCRVKVKVGKVWSGQRQGQVRGLSHTHTVRMRPRGARIAVRGPWGRPAPPAVREPQAGGRQRYDIVADG